MSTTFGSCFAGGSYRRCAQDSVPFLFTNEIADILLKACVFRREYYNETFLRDLLDLRDPTLMPVQIKFVDKLYQVGKLPHGMYTEWPLKP
ncbi:hypothetical protein WDU94_002330 [Cyamophila willieti]